LPVENTPKIFDDSFRPQSKADEDARATFLAHGIFARSHAHMRMAIEQSSLQSNGTFDPSTALDPSAAAQAAKKLAVMSVHLAGLECGGADNSEWFVDFLFAAMSELDAMSAQPSARSLVEMHGQWIVDEIISGVSRNAASSVELPAMRTPVAQQLIKSLSDDASYREDVVIFSLTESLEVLQEHQTLFDFSAL